MALRATLDSYLPGFVSSFFAKSPPTHIDVIKDTFNPDDADQLALIKSYQARFVSARDDLKQKHTLLAAAVVGVSLLWVGNLNFILVVGISAGVAFLDLVTFHHLESSQAFTKSLNELEQLYLWCRASHPQHPLVAELKAEITPFAQPAFSGMMDKASYFFDTTAKNAMMITSGKHFQDESLAKSRPFTK